MHQAFRLGYDTASAALLHGWYLPLPKQLVNVTASFLTAATCTLRMNHLDSRDYVHAARHDLLSDILRSMLDGRAERTHLVRHGLVAFHWPVERIRSLPADAAVLAEAF